jgi:F-type H+-transporting ATPase subunit a
MRLLALAAAALQETVASPAPPDAHGATEAAQAAAHAPAAAEAAGHAAAGAAHGEGPAEVLMHHVVDQPFYGFQSKHLIFFCVAALLVIVVTWLARRGYKKGGVPTGLGAAVESLVIFVRDEIAEKEIGHGDGRRFTPLLLSFFFFILIAALFGLMPFSATSTGNISVTMALAIVSFAAQQWGGISKHGLVHHFTGIVPPGLPAWLLPIMIPVEILSMFTKPFALMVRLFANMLAGHMVITALILLIPMVAQVSEVLGFAMIPISLSLALFIMILEVLVAFIQAYIFTLLTAIFIGMYVHPAH